MKIVVNGIARSYKGEVTVFTVLKDVGATVGRVAVVVNDEVVSRAELDMKSLKDGDRLEILTYAAGG
ncbi:MAG: sulfur carrier protein ThiS [bacterium]